MYVYVVFALKSLALGTSGNGTNYVRLMCEITDLFIQ